MRSFGIWFLGLGAACVVAGCSSTPEPAVRYVEPGAAGSVAGTGVESQDIAAAARRAAQSFLALDRIANAPEPPVILIAPVKNLSASPVDVDLYTVKMRGTLMQEAPGRVRFLARDSSWDLNEQEQQLRAQGKVADRSGKVGRLGQSYDYILTAELRGLSASGRGGRSEFFLVAFKLIDFQDVLVWESQYEIKKEGREALVYR